MYIGNQKVRPKAEDHSYWTISNATDAGTCNLNQSNYYDNCLEFSADGLHFYASSNATTNGPYQVDLGTAWDVTTATGQTNLHSSMYFGNSWNGNGVPHWNANGTQCTNTYGYTAKGWTPGSVYDLSASRTQDWSETIGVELSRGWKFINDGNKIICPNYTYDLSTAYDLRTIGNSASSTNSNISGEDPDFFMNNDGTHLYFTAKDSGGVKHYILSTAWDISTATLVETFSQSNATGLYFHGDKMYIKYRASAVKQFTVVYEI